MENLVSWMMRPMNRQSYAVWGFGLMFFKYVVEYSLVQATGGAEYGFLSYLSPLYSTRIQALAECPGWVMWFVVSWSLPFVMVAILFSVRRAVDAGLSPWVSLWIICPLFNLVFMTGMCLVPSGFQSPAVNLLDRKDEADEKAGVVRWIVSMLLGLTMAPGFLVVSIYALGAYGATGFFASPLVLGAISGFSWTRLNRNRTRAGSAIGVSVAALLLGAGILVAIGVEGVVCIVMAMPIMVPAVAIGGFIGYGIALSDESKPPWMAALVLLPVSMLVDHSLDHTIEYEVVSTVEIDAPPEMVWQSVVEFPDIRNNPGWMFQLGVAWPIRAHIVGSGVGAVRYCEFSTGDFVEPITDWNYPERLAFSVTEQPEPLTELTPWKSIHPPHLDGFMRSHRGEFRLVKLAGGRTRLEGRTWYSVDMYPQMYWKMWTDSIVHSIHYRVLNHIRETVENNTASLYVTPVK